jgi:hypothetical protein
VSVEIKSKKQQTLKKLRREHGKLAVPAKSSKIDKLTLYALVTGDRALLSEKKYSF